MRAAWIDGAVAEFGRHFGFERFAEAYCFCRDNVL